MRQNNISALLNPKSVAVIGVSRDKSKLGNKILHNIIDGGYKGDVFAVNKKGGQVSGFILYQSILEIDIPVDLVIISIPAQYVPDALLEAGQAGAKSAIVISAGFGEIGEDGRKLEKRISQIARDYNITVLGPNCLGLMNTTNSLNASFSSRLPAKGDVVFISQSGAFCTAALDWAAANNLGFLHFISIGNKALLDENKLLEYYYRLIRSGQYISSIALYLEDFKNGAKFIEIARKISRKVPIVVLKPGRSNQAKNAIALHTGSLAESDEVVDQALKQAGCIRVEGIQEMFKLIRALSWQPIPKGSNVAIVTNAGGPAIITTDRIVSKGMKIADFSDKTLGVLRDNLPRTANIHDPVDIIGDALSDRYKAAIDAVLSEKSVDSLIVLLTPQVMTEINETARAISSLSRVHGKTVLASFIGGKDVEKGIELLNKNRIPSSHFPELMVDILSYMNLYRERKEKIRQPIEKGNFIGARKLVRVNELLETILSEGRFLLRPSEIEEISRLYGLSYLGGVTVGNFAEMKKYAQSSGFPIVAKIASERILHKTDMGGVITGIQNFEQLRGAYDQLTSLLDGQMINYFRKIGYIQLQPQLNPKIEMIIGAKKEPGFGNILVFGSGGIYAELYKDVNSILLPSSKIDILGMIEETKVYKLIRGYRGSRKFRVNPLYDQIRRVGELMSNHEQIEGIDINPIMYTDEGLYIVDMKIVLSKQLCNVK